MKVTVKDKYLNVRLGFPSVNADCNQFIAPGSEIEVDGQLYKGDAFNGIDTWLKDSAGNYYWSGGVENSLTTAEPTGDDLQAFLNRNFDGTHLRSVINYNSLLKINERLKTNLGQGVTIAIIDHPISSGLESNVSIQRPLGSEEPLRNFHGNFIFGLIAGIRNIVGIANRVRIISLPIFDQDGGTLPDGIANALNFIKNSPDPMIVNISNSFGENFDDIFNGFSENKIIVASAGVNADLENNPLQRYPASIKNAVSIGAIDSNSGNLHFNSKVNLVLPDFNYVSVKDVASFRFDSGDSFATAIVSATIALLISSGSVGFDVPSIIQSLRANAVSAATISSHMSLNLLNTSA